MKLLIVIVFVLLLTGQSGAETYSWVDDRGTYNFTEDLSQVPKKYIKKVKLRGDMGSHDAAPVAEPANANPEQIRKTEPRQVEGSSGKPNGLTGGDTKLYGGKTQDAWRNELKSHESELTSLEQQLEQIKKQITTTSRLTIERQGELIKQYENARTDYNLKYKIYSELIESARKAGLIIEIKK